MQVTYTRMWQQIKVLCSYAYANQIIMDFKKAAINSFEQFWPDTFVKCCFFHLTQNVWRKVQSEGLQSEYNQNEELAIRIRLLPGLAFAAPHEVPIYLAMLYNNFPCSCNRSGFIFRTPISGRALPGGSYQEALFPNEMWNYHFDTPSGLSRTTNVVEAWHRSIMQLLGAIILLFGSLLVP